MGNGELNPLMGMHAIQGGVVLLLIASCYKNRRHWPDGTLRSYADFTYPYSKGFVLSRHEVIQYLISCLSVTVKHTDRTTGLATKCIQTFLALFQFTE